MAVVRGRGPAGCRKGRCVRGCTGPNLALRIVAAHARGELELAPVPMTGMEAVQSVRSKGAVVE
eukprot:12313691-Alexandrium_andersonii.AAC.1